MSASDPHTITTLHFFYIVQRMFISPALGYLMCALFAH